MQGDERVRCSTMVNHEKGEYYIEKFYEDVSTVYDTLKRGLKESSE